MPKFNTIVVHDTEYEMNRSYMSGARAFRQGVPNSCNPHRDGSYAHDSWDYGHVNESADEHFRFGEDLLMRTDTGERFEMDPAVPRIKGADVDPDWSHKQRTLLQA